MPKRTLCLYVESELIELAKSMGINMSEEFGDWMKIRMNKMDESNSNQTEDPDLIIAQHRAEIMKLESKKEQMAAQSEKEKELDMIIKDVVDNIVKEKEAGDNPHYIDQTWQQIIAYRSPGLQFLVKKRMNKILTLNEAEEMISKELKSRGIEL